MLAPVHAIADAFNHDTVNSDGPCATVDVTAEPAAQVVQDLPWQQLVAGNVTIADPLSNTEGIATLALAQRLSPASNRRSAAAAHRRVAEAPP